MVRLIDADAIPWFVEGIGDIPVVTKDEIDGMPTVELIRCNDCKWYSANAGYHWGRCENYRPYPFDETDYCSRAERRKDETD